MSVIIEAAVMNMRLREYGVDSSKEFVDRILKNIDKNKGKLWLFPDGKTFVQIGSFSIAWYAICIITGAFIAYKLGQYNFKKIGYNKEILSDYFFGLMITGVLGARLWYVIFMWNELYAENPLEIIMFRHGGLAIQGGILLAWFLAGGILRNIKLISWLQLMQLCQVFNCSGTGTVETFQPGSIWWNG